jgi:hypothetical protein
VTSTEPSPLFLRIAADSPSALADRMRTSPSPDRASLAGWEYRGINTAGWLRALGADRFIKGFADGYGYNRRVRRGPRTSPWLANRGPEPKPFGFYAITPVHRGGADDRYPNALLLDYSAFARRIDPTGSIRDYLVTLDESEDLLLGHAFAAIGHARVHASFFVLERLRQPASVGRPPSRL